MRRWPMICLALALALAPALAMAGDWWLDSITPEPEPIRPSQPPGRSTPLETSLKVDRIADQLVVVARAYAEPGRVISLSEAMSRAKWAARELAYQRMGKIIAALSGYKPTDHTGLAGDGPRLPLPGHEVVQETRDHISDAAIWAEVRLSLPLPDSALVDPELEKPVGAEVSGLEAVLEKPTGLIIDARGLGAERGFRPRVYDASGNLLYGLGPEDTAQDGRPAYAFSLEQAKADPQAGGRPLVIQATAVKPPYKSDLVISDRDATLIRKRLGWEKKLAGGSLVLVVD